MTRGNAVGLVGVVVVAFGACADGESEVTAEQAAVSATERFVSSASVMTAIGGPLASRDALVDNWGEDIVALLVADESCAVLSWQDPLTASIELHGCTAGTNGVELSGTIGLSVELAPLRLFISLDRVQLPNYGVQGWAAIFGRDVDSGAFMLEGSVTLTEGDKTATLALFDVDMAVGAEGIEVAGTGYRESARDYAHFELTDVLWNAADCMPSRGSFAYADVAVTFLSSTPQDGIVALRAGETEGDSFVWPPCWSP